MPIVNVENVGRVGVISDVPAHMLPPEAWSNAANMRFEANYAEKFQGHQTIYGTPGTEPYWLLPWQTSTGYLWLYASADQIWHTDGTTHTNVTRYTATPGDDDYTGNSHPIWSGGILHGVPIMNHEAGTDYPQQWDGATSRFKDLSNWQASVYAKIIRPFQNFLVALDVTKSGTRYPYMVKWSHPADPGTVPSSWDETDATKLAGEHTIAQSGGFLLDCLPLKGVNILYKSDAIWGMQLVGGLRVFRWFEIDSTIGILAPKCVKAFYNRHFLVGQNDIVLFDGVRPQSIVHEKVAKHFYKDLNSDDYFKTFVTPNYARKEMWICYSSASNTTGYVNKALVWNWENNNWTFKDLPYLTHIGYGRVGSPPTSFDNTSGSFDTDFGEFGEVSLSPAELQLLAGRVETANQFMQMDDLYTDRGTNYQSSLERLGLTIVGQDRNGAPKTDPASVKQVNAIYPKVVSATPIDLKVSVAMQDSPEGAVRWEGPYDYNSDDEKVDFDIAGKYVGIRICDCDNAQPWQLLGYGIDLEIISRL